MRAQAPTDPTPGPPPVSEHVPTEPGIGPGAQADAASGPRTPPMGLIVPAASRVKANKNSVELLLEGMQGPQPERPKTTPQTDGQASASYHAEHGVRPARTSPDDEPKVVVERAPLVPTRRIDRVRIQRALDQADAQRQVMEPPAVIPQQMAPRVVAALVAGVTVVGGLFLVLRFTMGAREPTRPAMVTPAALIVPPPPLPLPPAGMASAAPETSTELPPPAPAPPATVEPASVAPRPAATAAASARPRTPRVVPAGTSSAPDLGEFKTTFH
jgi:hypothetical protein